MWYKPDLSLHSDMILMLGKNKQIAMAEELFCELKKEGLDPDTRVYTEMIGVYLQVGMIDKAMMTYETMKVSGCTPHKLTFTILIRNLENAGEEELVAAVRRDCIQYVEFPERFLEEVYQKHVRIPLLLESIIIFTISLLHPLRLIKDSHFVTESEKTYNPTMFIHVLENLGVEVVTRIGQGTLHLCSYDNEW